MVYPIDILLIKIKTLAKHVIKIKKTLNVLFVI